MALDLARDLIAPRGPVPQLRRGPLLPIAAVLTPYARHGWGPADVKAALDARLAARGAGRYWQLPDRPDRPAAWLKWALRNVDPMVPPMQHAYQQAQERAARRRADDQARRAEQQRLDQAAVPATASSAAAELAALRARLPAGPGGRRDRAGDASEHRARQHTANQARSAIDGAGTALNRLRNATGGTWAQPS